MGESIHAESGPPCAGNCGQEADFYFQSDFGLAFCPACIERVEKDLCLLARLGRFPTPELVLSLAQRSDLNLSLRRRQALEHVRDIVQWAALLAGRLSDRDLADDAFDFAAIEQLWAGWSQGRTPDRLAEMECVLFMLAGATDELAEEGLLWFRARWLEPGGQLDSALFLKAARLSRSRPDWEAIAAAVDTARIGPWRPLTNPRDPESLRTEYARWKKDNEAASRVSERRRSRSRLG